MQIVTKKSVVESPSSKSTTAKETDIASVPIPDTFAAFHVNPETASYKEPITSSIRQGQGS